MKNRKTKKEKEGREQWSGGYGRRLPLHRVQDGQFLRWIDVSVVVFVRGRSKINGGREWSI